MFESGTIMINFYKHLKKHKKTIKFQFFENKRKLFIHKYLKFPFIYTVAIPWEWKTFPYKQKFL